MNNDSRLLSEAYKTIVEQTPQLTGFNQNAPMNTDQIIQAFGLDKNQEKAVKDLLKAFNVDPANPQASQRAIIGMVINGLAKLAQQAVTQPLQQPVQQQQPVQNATIAPMGSQGTAPAGGAPIRNVMAPIGTAR